MKVLILGSNGFIGAHLATHFFAKGYAVTGCDLTENGSALYPHHKVDIDSPDFDEILRFNQFDYCINAAGSGNVSYSIQHPLLDFHANTAVVANVLEAIRKSSRECKYIHFSSAAVYGNPEILPINEVMKSAPVSPYGWHKHLSEILCQEYQELFHVNSVILRPFSVYGRGLQKQLLWDLCCKLQHVDYVELSGTGNESRDFIHIADLANAVEMIINNVRTFSCTMNIASGVETPISYVAEEVASAFPGKKKVGFNGIERKGDPVNWRADVSQLESVGFKTSIRLSDGLRDYVKWFLNKVNEQ